MAIGKDGHWQTWPLANLAIGKPALRQMAFDATGKPALEPKARRRYSRPLARPVGIGGASKGSRP